MSAFLSLPEGGCLIQPALLPPKVLGSAVPSKHSSAGDLNKPFPFQTSIITRIIKLQDAFGNVDLWLGKKQNRKVQSDFSICDLWI